MKKNYSPVTKEILQCGDDEKTMQSLYGATKYTGDRPWPKHDSWDSELACKLIVFDYPVDMNGTGWDAVINWPIDKWGRKSSIALRCLFDRAVGIAQSSVNAGTIKEHDTPANWIAWAQDKGYSVAHLLPTGTSDRADALSSEGFGAETSAKPDDWRRHARQIADECFEWDTESNCRDSLAGYSKRVMARMQEREIHGPRGLINNPHTIQRDALQGAKWWKHKTK